MLKKLKSKEKSIGEKCPGKKPKSKFFEKCIKFYSKRDFFEITTVYCIIRQENSILLLRRRKPDVWELPGGKIELGETPKEAAKREVKEETGLVINDAKLFDVSSSMYPVRDVQQLNIIYLSELEEKTTINLTDEHQSYKWVDLKDIGEIKNIAASVAPSIPKLIKYE